MSSRFNNLKRERPPHPTIAWWIGLSVLALIVALAMAFCTPRARASDCGGLYALALEHSQDMARRDHLDHAGFFNRRGPAGARAENVAYGYRTEAQTRAQWWRSPPHAANMRRGGCQAIAHACNARRCYWTMEIQ